MFKKRKNKMAAIQGDFKITKNMEEVMLKLN